MEDIGEIFVRLVNVDLGFAPGNVATLQAFYYADDGTGVEATPNFYSDTLVRSVPREAAGGLVPKPWGRYVSPPSP